MTYVYLMENQKLINKEIISRHVEHLKELNRQGKLLLCGPFTDYPGGMVIFQADNLQEATNVAASDPFITSGCKTFTLRTFELANEDNNYLIKTEKRL